MDFISLVRQKRKSFKSHKVSFTRGMGGFFIKRGVWCLVFDNLIKFPFLNKMLQGCIIIILIFYKFMFAFTLNTFSLVLVLLFFSCILSDKDISRSNEAMPSAVVLSNPHKLFLWLAEHCFRM